MERLRAAICICLAWAAGAYADGGFLPPADYTGEDLHEPCQRAVIVHAEGLENLFLFVDYNGGADRFAWIVPCPSKPKVDTADPAIFKEVAAYYHHLRMTAWRKRIKDAPGEGIGVGGSPVQASKVIVHMTKLTGPYKIAVISSTDAGALRDWLTRNSYRIPKGLQPVLDEYVREGWFFVAVKARAETGRDITLKPLRLDFQTEVPLYPLRISAASRGVTDIRVYLFRDTRITISPERQRSYGATFRVNSDMKKMCLQLTEAVRPCNWRQFELTRISDKLVPQVLSKLDDRIYRENAVPGVTFYPYVSLARTAGIAEALMSKNPAEARWAEENIHYYYYAKPRPGKLPAPHLAVLADIGRRFGKPLRDKLIAIIEGLLKSRRQGSRCEGALVLLARTSLSADTVVIACLEKAAASQEHGNCAINALMDLGSPESRRALARVAFSKSTHRVGAAFRFVYSLERNSITSKEKHTACGELLSMLSRGIAVGDAKKRGMNLLKHYTQRDFRENWRAWADWLEKNADTGVVEQREATE